MPLLWYTTGKVLHNGYAETVCRRIGKMNAEKAAAFVKEHIGPDATPIYWMDGDERKSLQEIHPIDPFYADYKRESKRVRAEHLAKTEITKA